MRVSELVQRLQELQQEYGDVDVYVDGCFEVEYAEYYENFDMRRNCDYDDYDFTGIIIGT